jgi:hypothetical protein
MFEPHTDVAWSCRFPMGVVQAKPDTDLVRVDYGT